MDYHDDDLTPEERKQLKEYDARQGRLNKLLSFYKTNAKIQKDKLKGLAKYLNKKKNYTKAQAIYTVRKIGTSLNYSITVIDEAISEITKIFFGRI